MALPIDTHIVTTPGISGILNREFNGQRNRDGEARSAEDRTQVLALKTAFRALLRRNIGPHDASVLRENGGLLDLWREVNACVEGRSAELAANHPGVLDDLEAARRQIVPEIWGAFLEGPTDLIETWDVMRLGAQDATASGAQRQQSQYMQGQMGGSVITTMYDHLRRQVPDWDGDGLVRLGLQERLTLLFLAPRGPDSGSWMEQLLADAQANAALRITPSWLQLNHPALYEQIFQEIRDPESTIPHWHQILRYFPQSLLTQVDIDSFTERHEALTPDQLTWLRNHRDLAAQLGPNVLCDVMSQEFPELAGARRIPPRVIINYLGSLTRTGATTAPQVAAIRPEMFDRYPQIREIVFLALRRSIYEHLLRFEEQQLAAGHNVTQAQFLTELPRIISTHYGAVRSGSPQHQALLDEVINEWNLILRIPCPRTINPTVRDSRGSVHRVPSLRQLVGMNDIAEKKRMLFPWPMGKGKTLGAVLAAEHVKAKKILYVCPTNLINEMPSKIECYYTNEYRAELRAQGRQLVGVIRAGMSHSEIQQVIERSKIVIVPYSMLYQPKTTGEGEEQQTQLVRQMLQCAHFDFAIADEVHNAKNTRRRTGADDPDLTRIHPGPEDDELGEEGGDTAVPITPPAAQNPCQRGGRYTQELYDLLCHDDTTIQHLVLASGFVVPNRPDDIAAQLRLLFPSEFRGNRVNTLSSYIDQVNPLAMRGMLAKAMLNLDPLPEWEHYQHHDTFPLTAQEQAIIERIIARDDLTISQKITMVMLAIFNPMLVEPSHTQQPTMVREFAARSYDQIKRNGVSFGCESLRKEGILDNRDDERPLTYQRPTFVEMVAAEIRRLAAADPQRRFGPDQIDRFEIHGDTPLIEQERILHMARFPQHRIAAEIFAPLRALTQAVREGRNGLTRHRNELATNITNLLQHIPADVRATLLGQIGANSPVETQLRDAMTLANDSFPGLLRVLSDIHRPEFAQARAWLETVQSHVPQRGAFVTVWASMVLEGRDLTPIKEGLVFEPLLRLPDFIQWLMRFAREGHEAGVQFTLPMPDNTLHQAIWRNALYKFALCSALIQGGDFSPETLRLLEQGDVNLTMSFRNGHLSFGPFADGLLNLRQRLHVLRRLYTGMGENGIMARIRIEGDEYAELCQREWDQGGCLSENGANDVSAVLSALRRDGTLRGTEGADVGSGLCVLENTYGVNHRDMKITSVDLNGHSLRRGAEIVRRRRGDPTYNPATVTGGMTSLSLPEEHFDFMTSLHTLHELRQDGRTNFSSHERAVVLEQMNHKLKNGGVLILSLPHHVCTPGEFAAFAAQMRHFGFEIQQQYTGLHRPVSNPAPGSIPDWNSPQWVIALKKVGAVDRDNVQLEELNFAKAEQPRLPPSIRSGQFPSNYPHAFTIENLEGDVVSVEAERTPEHIASETHERAYRLAVARARVELVELSQGMPENLLKLDQGTVLDLEKRGIRLHYHLGKDRKPKDFIRFSVILEGQPARHTTFAVFEELGDQ